MNPSIQIRTLTDGGQQALEIARVIADFLGAAKRSLDLAQYDFNLGEETGRVEPRPVDVGETRIKPWFTPGHGEALSHRIAKKIAQAKHVRICSPVITAAPVLATLAQVLSDGKADVAGCVDATQVAEVVRQWQADANVTWKL